MDGPAHYREAEQLLEQTRIPASQRAVAKWRTADELVSEAQVHATLAVAAALAPHAADSGIADRIDGPVTQS